jgi:hypothetical protein
LPTPSVDRAVAIHVYTNKLSVQADVPWRNHFFHKTAICALQTQIALFFPTIEQDSSVCGNFKRANRPKLTHFFLVGRASMCSAAISRRDRQNPKIVTLAVESELWGYRDAGACANGLAKA